jgi:hypothetical protein
MSRHHEWYRNQWNEFLGRPEYRWRWYNVRWHGLPQAARNPSLWPPLELAVRSGLLGKTDPMEHPNFEFGMLHAFNRKIHGRFVRSISFITDITPYFDLLRLEEPLGVDGVGINTATSHAITDKLGGTLQLTRFSARKLLDISLDIIIKALDFHDAMEQKIAPYFFAWLTDFKSGNLEDFQRKMNIGRAGAEYLRVCELVRIPIFSVDGVAITIAEYSGFRDESIQEEMEAWREFKQALYELTREHADVATWPSDTVKLLLNFSEEHQSVLSEALSIRRATYAKYRRESEEALVDLEDDAGISIQEDYE